MQPTDLVILKKSYCDARGNSYPAKDTPYLYGELPDKIKDDLAYVVPVGTVALQQTVIRPVIELEQKITKEAEGLTKINPVYTKETFVEVKKEEPELSLKQSEYKKVDKLEIKVSAK